MVVLSMVQAFAGLVVYGDELPYLPHAHGVGKYGLADGHTGLNSQGVGAVIKDSVASQCGSGSIWLGQQCGIHQLFREHGGPQLYVVDLWSIDGGLVQSCLLHDQVALVVCHAQTVQGHHAFVQVLELPNAFGAGCHEAYSAGQSHDYLHSFLHLHNAGHVGVCHLHAPPLDSRVTVHLGMVFSQTHVDTGLAEHPRSFSIVDGQTVHDGHDACMQCQGIRQSLLFWRNCILLLLAGDQKEQEKKCE